MSPRSSGVGRGASVAATAGAAAAGVAVTLAVVFGITQAQGQDDPPRAAASPSASAGVTMASEAPTEGGDATAAAAPGASSICGLKAVEMSGTIDSAPKATWTLVGSAAVPAVEGQGPGITEADGFRSCFARTPTGAVTAAANLTGMGSVRALDAKLTDRSVAPGPGRDAAAALPSEGGDTTGVQIAGFRLLRYDGTDADVDLALRETATGRLASFVYNLQWSGGDWKIRLADNGELLSKAAPIPSLEGYVPWSGA